MCPDSTSARVVPLRRRHRNEGGYILILTVAALALLALAGAYIGERVSTALQLAAAEKALLEQERLMRDGTARVIYLLTTVKRSSFGLGTTPDSIRMDGRWYDAGDGVVASFQDIRGLINLRTAPRAWKEQLLATFGLELTRTQALVDTLEDYVDEDSLRRLQGAEADDYQKAGLLSPRNQALVTTTELMRVYGWKDEPSLWTTDGILMNASVERETGVNPNTATWRTLVAAFGLSNDAAKDAVKQRETSVVANPLSYLVKGNLDFMKLNNPTTFPSHTTVVTLGVAGSRRVWRFPVAITPVSKLAAWRVGAMQEVLLDKPLPENGLPKLPDLSGDTVNIKEEHPALPF